MACVFDIHSERAMFRKPYTTTSSVSYPFPPPTAVAGIVCAILGISNKSNERIGNAAYWEKMSGTQIAIRINKIVKWETQTVNFINTKKNQTGHVQIKHHYVKQPSYRIYLRGEMEEPLCRMLENQQTIYTPYLGVAYALAQIEYIGQFPQTAVETNSVDSVIPILDKIETIEPDMTKNRTLNKSEVPFEFNTDRALKHVIDVLYNTTAKPIYLNLQPDTIYQINNERVIFFPMW